MPILSALSFGSRGYGFIGALAGPPPVGQEVFTTLGTQTWTVPSGVTQISAVCVGGGGGGSASTLSSNGVSGGGGGGGGLHWRTFTVTPGETLTIEVGSGGSGGTAAGSNNASSGGESSIKRGLGYLIRAGGGSAGLYNATTGYTPGGATYYTTLGGGGGTGGQGGCGSNGNTGGGGGGASGYSGNGGDGSQGTSYNETAGQGGGGGGGTGANGLTTPVTFGGGGVGLLGEGTSGAANLTTFNQQGNPGSGGNGLQYGGGGSGAEDDSPSSGGNGGQGAVRIIWGEGRSYPSTGTDDQFGSVTASVTPTTTNVNEGSSVTFNVTTSLSSGTLYWTLNQVSGTINASDFTGGVTSGSFAVSGGAGSVTLTLANDLTTEGTESFQFVVRQGSTSGTILATSSTVTINDTSTTPTPTASVTPTTTNVNEGGSVTFNVSTTNFTSGTLYWTLNQVSGTINASDFTGGVTSGSFAVSGSAGSVTLTLANDTTTEGTESFQFVVRQGSTSGTILATSSTVSINDTSVSGPVGEIGYFAGGQTPGPSQYSIVEKIVFSTDTTTAIPGSNLSRSVANLAATGSPAAGYFVGGITGSLPTSYIDKITYSNDTRQAITVFSRSITQHTGVGNQSAGYFSGGYPSAFGGSRLDKITYSTDTSSFVPGTTLSSARYRHAGTGNQTAGYFSGGAPFPEVSTMDRLTYSTESIQLLPSSSFTPADSQFSATGNSTHGYWDDGNAFSTSNFYKMTYSTEVMSTLTNSLMNSGGWNGGTGTQSSGYFSGNGFNQTIVAKINYSNDTVSRNPSSYLSLGRSGLSAVGNVEGGFTPAPSPPAAPQAGYFGGGTVSAIVASSISKLTYSTDTPTILSSGANLSLARTSLGATGNTTSGYFGGGYVPSSASRVSTMDKITYLTETTVAVPGANLSSARNNVAATGNSTAGYFSGGIPNASVMDKVTYSSDTTILLPSSSFLSPSSNYSVAATGNSTAGYFGGGYVPSPAISEMHKITYSTDLRTAVPGANLTIARAEIGATGNSTAGYFGGGSGPVTTMDKVTYSTETTAAVPSANLNSAAQVMSATGNSSVGYFSGNNGQMNKTTYSTDTTVYIPAANISRFTCAAASPQANGL